MKKRKRLKKILRFSLQNMLIVLLIFLFALLVYAADQGLMGYKSKCAVDGRGGDKVYDINSLTTYYSEVEEHGTCKKIQYNTCSNDVFIPTKTSSERTTFIANKPSCINLGDCSTGHRGWGSWTLVLRTSLGTNVSNPRASYPGIIHAPVSSCGDDVFSARSDNPTGAGDCPDYELNATWDNGSNRKLRSSDRCSQFSSKLMSYTYCDGAGMDDYSVVRRCNDEAVGFGCVSNCKYLWAQCGYYAKRVPVWVNN